MNPANPLLKKGGIMMNLRPGIRKRQTRFLVVFLTLACWLFGVVPIALLADVTVERIDVGFNGRVPLGRWVPIQVTLSNAEQHQSLRLDIENVDGDAVPVKFRQPPTDLRIQAGLVTGLLRIGRPGPISIQVFDEQNQPLARRQFSLAEIEEDHQFVPSTTELTLVIGSLSESQGVTLAQAPGELPENYLPENYLRISNAVDLPEDWLGYDSIRQMQLSTKDNELLTAIKDRQIRALVQWVNYGGRLLIDSGESAGSFFGESGNLKMFSPGKFQEIKKTRNTGSIELFVNSNDPLTTADGSMLVVSKFETGYPNVPLLVDGDAGLIVRPFGLGIVSFLTFDLDSEPMKSWEGRIKLIGRAVMQQSGDSDSSNLRSGRVSHVGYEDFSGQLRAAMDRYSNVSFVAFTSVAILVGLFVIAIGPGDYFFLKRFVKRMEWTWITFIFLCISFCVLAIVILTWSKPKTLELNHVEIIDIDVDHSLVRGTVWANLYSPQTKTFGVQFEGTNEYFGELNDNWVYWQGLPGNGLGGLQSRNDLGLYRHSYDCLIEDDGAQCKMLRLPMAANSTKAIAGRWNLEIADTPASQLRQSPSTDAVMGTFTNPLPIRLANCVLLYGNWAYVMDRAIEPNETIDVESEMREKTLKGLYTRRRQSGGDDVNTPWDATDTSLSRILNLMMFYEAVGGEGYTKLTHDYQGYLDLSDHLRLGRAILVGQTLDVATPLKIDGTSMKADCDKKLTVARVVFPVAPRKQRIGN